jgi:hypothetical protein
MDHKCKDAVDNLSCWKSKEVQEDLKSSCDDSQNFLRTIGIYLSENICDKCTKCALEIINSFQMPVPVEEIIFLNGGMIVGMSEYEFINVFGEIKIRFKCFKKTGCDDGCAYGSQQEIAEMRMSAFKDIIPN